MKRPFFKKIAGLILFIFSLPSLIQAAGSFDGVSTLVDRGANVTASGWACHYGGVPIPGVLVYIDDIYVGNASQGGYRPDVQAANANGAGWSPKDVTYSGWNASIGTGSLSIGQHTMGVYAVIIVEGWVDHEEFNDEYGYWYTVTNWETYESWEHLGYKTFQVVSQPPVTVSASGATVELGQTTTLTGRATSAIGNLQWMDFYVTGPTMPGWNHVGGASISGSDSTGQMNWVPPAPGSWAVHIRAKDAYGQSDSNANIVAGFTIVDPVIAPPSSPRRISPSGAVTFAHLGDEINVPGYSSNNVLKGGYDGEGQWITWWEVEYSYGEALYWNGSSWADLGENASITVQYSGTYRLGGYYVYVLYPASSPSGSITADNTHFALGGSTTISAAFSAGSHDRLTNSNIDSPEGVGLQDGGYSTSRAYTFTPNAPGYYTFYARIATVCFGWNTYGTVGVTVDNVSPSNGLWVPDQVNAGQNISITQTADNPTGLGNYQVGFSLYERREDMNGGVYQDWTLISRTSPTGGNRRLDTARSTTEAGRILYRAYSWNQWMSEGSTGPVERVVTVNRNAQSISFGSPGNQTYGGAIGLSASASSGLPVSYSVSGPATLSGSTVYFTNGIGTVTIIASQGGNSVYLPASVSQSFTVNPCPTNFSLNTTSFTYNGSAQGPSIIANPSGAPYSVGGTLSATNAGNYTASASAYGNYTGSNGSLNWSIAKAGQTISFPNPGNQTYGTSIALNASASSGLPVSFSVSGPASLSGNTLNFTGCGSVTVTASQGGDPNYSAASSLSHSFSVNQRAAAFALNTTSFTYNGSAQGPSIVATPNDATYTVSGPLSGTGVNSYNLTVTATGNYSGSSSLTWYIATCTQNITFNSPADQIYGTDLVLNATASSGLPVSYSVASGPATVAGNTVHFTGVGSVTITASQTGDSSYSAAPNINRSFSVTPLTASFALNNVSYTYNGSAQGPSVVATPSAATFSTSGTLSAAAAGTYSATITATGNYTGSNVQAWTINKAGQSITFDNPGIQHAGTTLTLNATASSGLPVSYTASGPVSLNGNTVTFTKGGTATITASQPGDANYNAASNVSVSFTILRDPNADDDGDGIPNRLESLLGTDPDQTSSSDSSGTFKVHKP